MFKKESFIADHVADMKKADHLVSEIRRHQKMIQDQKEQYAHAVKRFRQKVSANQKVILRHILSLYIFYQQNISEFTEGGKKKIVSLESGSKIGSRLSNREVRARKPKEVIALIKKMGNRFIKEFIRTQIMESLDKEAIRKHPKDLLVNPEIAKLVRIIQNEQFMVEPMGGEPVSEDVEKLKRMI